MRKFNSFFSSVLGDKKLVCIPILQSLPRLDPELSGAGWKQASTVKDFVCDGEVPTVATYCRLGFYRGVLYIAFNCEEPCMGKLRFSRLEAVGRSRVAPILNVQYSRPKVAEDDYVDVLVDVHNSRSRYHQFVTNPMGKTLTARGVAKRDALESSYWQRVPGFKTHAWRGSRAWGVIMAIPLESLARTHLKPGDVIGLNLRRERTPVMETHEWCRDTHSWCTQQSTTMVYEPMFFGVGILGDYRNHLLRRFDEIEEGLGRDSGPQATVREIARLKRTIRSTGKVSYNRWMKYLGKLDTFEIEAYKASFGGRRTVVWMPRDDGLPVNCLVPPERLPAEKTPDIRKVSVTVPAGSVRHLDVFVTVLDGDARFGKLKVVPLDPEGPILHLRKKRRAYSRSLPTIHLTFSVASGSVTPGMYRYDVEISDKQAIHLMVTVVTVENLVAASGYRVARRAVPKKILANRDFFELFSLPIWNRYGLENLGFIRDAGSVVTPGLLMANYKAAVRQIEIYEEASSTNISPEGEPVGMDLATNLSALNDGELRTAATSPASAALVVGWFGIEFEGLRRVNRVVVHHGETFKSTVGGYRVDYLNVADCFRLQYWSGHWKEIAGTLVTGNRSARTEVKFPTLLTRKIRVCIESQSVPFEYPEGEEWRYWFEGIEETTQKKQNMSDIQKKLTERPFYIRYLRYLNGHTVNFIANPVARRAYRSLKEKFRNTFLGFWFAEWGVDIWHTSMGLLEECWPWQQFPDEITPLCDGRKAAHDAIKQQVDKWTACHYNDWFGMNSWRRLEHYGMEWGGRAVCNEFSANGCPSFQTQMAFMRGAARQYGRPMWAYHAVWLGRAAAAYVPRPGAAWRGPQGGLSPFALFRATLVSYFGGANLLERESEECAYVQFDKRRKRYVLSPHGETIQRLCELRQKHPDRGTPYAPIGILIDYLHGWTVPYTTGTAYGISGGKIVWHRDPYKRGDHMLNEYLHELFPWSAQRLERHGMPLANSRYGDIFDVLVANPPSGTLPAEVLEIYKVLLLLGDIDILPETEKRLLDYVKAGGTLVVNSVHTREAFKDVLGTRKREVILHDQRGKPVIERHRLGKGWILLTVPEYTLDRRNCLLPFVSDMLHRLTEEVLPVSVVGDVEYLVNRTKKGWLIVLLNNKGVYKEPKQYPVIIREEAALVDIRYPGDVVGAEEWLENAPLSVCSREGETVIEVTVPAGGVRIVELKMR